MIAITTQQSQQTMDNRHLLKVLLDQGICAVVSCAIVYQRCSVEALGVQPNIPAIKMHRYSKTSMYNSLYFNYSLHDQLLCLKLIVNFACSAYYHTMQLCLLKFRK